MTCAVGVKDGLRELVGPEGSGRPFRNLNDAAVTILAEHFGYDYEPTGRAPRAQKSDHVNWSVPLKLRQKINQKLERVDARRELRGEPKLSRSDHLNAIFVDYLDARRSVAA